MKANSPIWPSGKTVQVMVVDETDAETDVAWTTVGVTEREIITDSYSEYYYDVTDEAGHEYSVYFRSVEDDPYFASEVLRSPATVELTEEDIAAIAGAISGSPYVVNIDAQITEYDEFTEEIKIYTGTTPAIVFTVTKDGDPVDLSGKTVYLVVKKNDKTLLANAIINKVGVVSGTYNNIVTFTLTAVQTTALTGKEGNYAGQLDIGPDQTVTPKFNVVIERKLRQ